MSTHQLIRSSLALAFAFTVTGTALAETRGGYRDSIRSAACAPAAVGSTSYRDAHARLNSAPQGSVGIQVAGYRGHGPSGQRVNQVASVAGSYCSL